ncbi:MAG TPA: UDP-galactopyranose mutase [Nocardioides bacterium]|uniref:phytoene desaturase family protein n=1 Tax=uncultured Nocardioides sp. TaxID=198441 RepID=UPI000EE58E21|nr:FAD-dependent oxidoreductase [uncultured Nocardioides sp.]HCB05970.1 UDP-galactopyranose mutase [Nocardioides sp.]
MRVVVVGGGFGGLASAARLAKLGHDVTLLERLETLGGAVSTVAADGFEWDAGPTATLLPAVVRDLFRKSGRPLERELGFELEPLDLVREHWFADGTVVALPGHSRAAQRQAFDTLGAGLGERWVSYVDSFSDDWEVLRRAYFESAWDPGDLSREVAARLDSREMLHKRLRRTFKDERLRLVAGHPFVAEGHDLRNVPAWAGLVSYLERQFGTWTLPGGMGRLSALLTDRLATRRVTVERGVTATDLIVRSGRVVAVATASGQIDADAVVCAVDPRLLPALAPYVERTMPAMPPVICHVGVASPVPGLAPEVVLHGNPMLVLRTGGQAPTGGAAYTVHGRGRLAEDILTALARQGIDLRADLVSRVDETPRDLVERWQSSPYGVLWQGRGTVRQRLGPRTPIAGVYAAGAHATPGAGLPFVGLSAALVAQVVGPA